MSYYNNSNDGGKGAFYQPSNQFAFPQGSMSFQSGGNNSTGNMMGGTDGNGLGLALDPLPSGILNALSTRGYAHEPPLLEEVGINFGHIIAKTKLVSNPMSKTSVVSQEILNDSDLAGPLLFFLMFGLFLLAAGKVHFGYIYGVALFGTISLHTLSKFMSTNESSSNLQFFNTASILGYCFLPMCFLSSASIFLSLNNTVGYIIAAVSVSWSTWSSSGFLNALLQLHHARALIAYPLLIFYSVFALMAIFV